MISTMRILGAALCVILTVLGVAQFPVIPAYLGLALALYGALLWCWPAFFLLFLPVVLPAWDIGIWSGWLLVDEADLFVLVTLAVLMIRVPPPWSNSIPTGLPRKVLLAFSACWVLATAIGLSRSFGMPPSDNAFLRPDNALRIAKAFAEAVALLPFLRHRERSHGDGISLLGYGMSLGLVVVAAIVGLERILFVPFLDFTATYRVVGPFSSMRTGGGHIGAYAALALPMTLCLPRLRPRSISIFLLPVAMLLGTYIVAVSFARAAYAASAVAIFVSGMGWMWAAWRQHRPLVMGVIPSLLVAGAIPSLLVVITVIVGSMTGGMHQRLMETAQDFVMRRIDRHNGLAIRDMDVLTDIFGMGLGTYERAMLARSPVDRPSDIVISQDRPNGRYVSLRIETRFYFGQKISVPEAGNLHVSLRARAPDGPAPLEVMVCDKVLLYSDRCRGGTILLERTGVWQPVSITLPISGLGGPGRSGWLHRLVELSFSGLAGHRIEMAAVSLLDDAGHELVQNGDFDHGLNHWVFTDDTHTAWRMFNEYLMLWFETGALGILTFLALAGVAIAGGVRVAWEGSVTGAAVSGAIVGFLTSCMFDNLFEAPRLATLFFLVCMAGLVLFEERAQSRSTSE